MAKARQLRSRRNALFIEQGGRCHWCRCEMVHPPAYRTPGKRAPNEATIDHLYPRGDPRRRLPNNGGQRRYVVSCYACNHLRGDMPVELWFICIRQTRYSEAA